MLLILKYHILCIAHLWIALELNVSCGIYGKQSVTGIDFSQSTSVFVSCHSASASYIYIYLFEHYHSWFSDLLQASWSVVEPP